MELSVIVDSARDINKQNFAAHFGFCSVHPVTLLFILCGLGFLCWRNKSINSVVVNSSGPVHFHSFVKIVRHQ